MLACRIAQITSTGISVLLSKMRGTEMAKDNSTGKNKDFYDLGKRMFDRLNPAPKLEELAERKTDIVKPPPDRVWQVKVDYTRTEAMRVIRDIRQGLVNEYDIDMLQNFVQFSLALMQAEGPKKWELAKMNAELINLIHDTSHINRQH
jgi:hypothetical protein